MTKHCGQSAHFYEGLLFLALTIFSPTVFVGCGGSGGTATSATVDTGTVVGRIVPEAGVVLGREQAGRESKIINGNNARAYVFPSNTNARELVPSNSAPSSTLDDGGNYTIANVPAGEVIIVVDYDNDGIADEREFNIEVAKGQTTNAGTTEVSKLNKDPKGSWCDVMLDKNSYNTGESIKMTMAGFNYSDAEMKCGIKIVLQKEQESGEKWKTDFSITGEFITISEGQQGSGTITKEIPYTWESTNTSPGSNYKAYTIKEDGTVWGKFKDNFNIFNSAACITNTDCNDSNELTADVCVGAGTKDAICTNMQCSIACGADMACNDNNHLTIDTCVSPNTCQASCSNLTCAPACSVDAECNDNNAMTNDACANPGTCASACSNIQCEPECTTGSDCNDGNPLTVDTCSLPNTCGASCVNTLCTAICDSNTDCDDNNTGTKDACMNPASCEASCAHSVNAAPTGAIAYDSNRGTEPFIVSFTGGCEDADGTCVSYSWDFGDGSPNISTQNATHIFQTFGTYTVTLTVSDDDGASYSTTTLITVLALGKIVFASNRDGDNEIYIMEGAGINAIKLTDNNVDDEWPGVSPDNSKIVFHSNLSGIYQMYTMNIDGTNREMLADGVIYQNITPRYSSDGTQIVFSSDRDGHWEIYKMSSNGANQIRLSNCGAGVSCDMPQFSPDGTKILYRSNPFGDIFVMDSDGTNNVNLTNNTELYRTAAFSPDGMKIAFLSLADGDREVFLMNADGSNKAQITFNSADDTTPFFTDDGRIVFVSDRDGNTNIYMIDQDGSNEIRLTNDSSSDSSPFWIHFN